MTNKEHFIEEVANAIETNQIQLSTEGMTYFKNLQQKEDKNSHGLTEKTAKILAFMQENENTYNNIFNAKGIGDAMHVPSRQVSGSFQKLVKDGYCDKMVGTSPVCYQLTDFGRKTTIDTDRIDFT